MEKITKFVESKSSSSYSAISIGLKFLYLRFLTITFIAFFSLSCNDVYNSQLEQANKEIVRQAFAAVSNGDIDNMGTYIAENYNRHSQATPDVKVESLEEFKAFLRQDRKTFPDQKLEIVNLVAEGDLVAFWAVYKATQTGQMGPFPPSNQYAELEFSGIHKLESGKISKTWITWDNLAMLSQLGHFPPPTENQME